MIESVLPSGRNSLEACGKNFPLSFGWSKSRVCFAVLPCRFSPRTAAPINLLFALPCRFSRRSGSHQFARRPAGWRAGCGGALGPKAGEGLGEEPAEEDGEHQEEENHENAPDLQADEAERPPRREEPGSPEASTENAGSRTAKEKQQPPPRPNEAEVESVRGYWRRRLVTLALAHAFSLSQRQRHRTP